MRGKRFMKRFRLGIIILSLLCLVLAACGGTSSTTASIPTPQATKPAFQTRTGMPTQMQTVKITIGDFYIHSAVTTFTTGTFYQFLITNVGTHYHNLLLMHPIKTIMTPEDAYRQALTYAFNIAPNQTKSTYYFFDHTAPPGMLEFSCHYGGHYEAGMHQAIVVNAAPGTSASPYPNNGIPPHAISHADASCDPVVTIKSDNNAYTPAKASLKAGETLTITNTGNPYTPTFSPQAGETMMIGGLKDTMSFTFNYPGTFTLSSKEHPETKAIISVSSTAGSTCGITPMTTVYFSTSYLSRKSGHFFTPTHVTIKKGQSIKLSNLIDQDYTFISTPNAGFGTINIVHYEDKNLLFTTAGTYTISCVHLPGKKFTVTVQ
jgi:plastocyanin